MAMNPFLPISFWSAWRKAKWLEQFTTLPEPINLFKPVGREFESRPTHQLYKSPRRNLGGFFVWSLGVWITEAKLR